MPVVLKTPLALQDAADIWSYIAQDNTYAADQQLARFESALQMVSDLPGLGVDRREFAPNLRGCRVGKYLLFYRPLHDGIELIRILHGARDLPAVLRETRS